MSYQMQVDEFDYTELMYDLALNAYYDIEQALVSDYGLSGCMASSEFTEGGYWLDTTKQY